MDVPPRSRASVRDVAERAGVSIATVSRVLNGQPGVAEGTRRLVLQVLDELGPSAPIARDDEGPADGPVFVRCPYLLTDYFGLIVSAIADELASRGRPLLLDAGESSQQRHPLGALPVRSRTAGAILILPPEEAPELLDLRRKAFPFVIVDPRTEPPAGTAVVSAAHRQGARTATAHLIALGHRRIGVLAGPDDWMASRERLAGHAAGMAEAGLRQDPALVASLHADEDAGHVAALRLLGADDRPTALVCFNDKVAVGALRAARELGLRVPDDLSVVGFDDSDLGRASTPQLTTVWQPLAEMGRLAVAQLARLVEGRPMDSLHLELATRLVVRDSSGPAPAS